MVGWTRRNRESSERQQKRIKHIASKHQFGSLTIDKWLEDKECGEKTNVKLLLFSVGFMLITFGLLPLLVWL